MRHASKAARAAGNHLFVALFALLASLAMPAAFAQATAPDALMKRVTAQVLATVRADKDIQAGDPAKIHRLVEAKVLPHFDFERATRIAVGVNWRRATPQQRERLVREFRALLVRTYSGALARYRDQRIDFLPLRMRPGATEVTVRCRVTQSGSEAIEIAYDMERTGSDWKVFDIRVGGVSLVATYRTSFAEEVRRHGIEGLVDRLSEKNRESTRS